MATKKIHSRRSLRHCLHICCKEDLYVCRLHCTISFQRIHRAELRLATQV